MNNEETTPSNALSELLTELRDSTNSQIKIFTFQERIIFGLVYNGLNNFEISERLFISSNTVKKHKAHIMSKLNVKGQCSFRKLLLKIKNDTEIL
jgi:DNA-binding NarL/FixJ family response regulator